MTFSLDLPKPGRSPLCEVALAFFLGAANDDDDADAAAAAAGETEAGLPAGLDDDDDDEDGGGGLPEEGVAGRLAEAGGGGGGGAAADAGGLRDRNGEMDEAEDLCDLELEPNIAGECASFTHRERERGRAVAREGGEGACLLACLLAPSKNQGFNFLFVEALKLSECFGFGPWLRFFILLFFTFSFFPASCERARKDGFGPGWGDALFRVKYEFGKECSFCFWAGRSARGVSPI